MLEVKLEAAFNSSDGFYQAANSVEIVTNSFQNTSNQRLQISINQFIDYISNLSSQVQFLINLLVTI